MAASPVVLRSQPGIKRDGTRFEGDGYIDGLWTRFQRGLPRKMGGYRAITSQIPEIARGLTSYSSGGRQYLHMGGADSLTQVVVDSDGNFAGLYDRIPAGWVAVPQALWQFGVINSSISATDTKLIAHESNSLNDISSELESNIYLGDMTANTPLTNSGMDPQSGGVVVLHPYLITYGNGGRVDCSAPNDPMTQDGTAFVTGQKIIKGLPLRGNSGPAGILWSLDSIVQMTFNSAITSGVPFNFTTLTEESSILSSQGVIEWDGVYYWPGVDRWLMFNGTIREVPNQQNLNWFFDNVNYAQRQKVVAFKLPRWGEIWWCYPHGSATECTHAVILNVREGYWYDTLLPNSGRSAAIYPKVYNKPFMVDVDLTDTGYTLWQHETGTDQINGATTNAIQSYFETSEVTAILGQGAQDTSIRVSWLEPDFVQVGSMNVTIKAQANARAPVVDQSIHSFVDVATIPSEQLIPLKTTGRVLYFRFESNIAGGDYQMGLCLIHVGTSDQRKTS